MNSNFYGKNTYKDENPLISQFKVVFAQRDKADFYKSNDHDTFSVSGVWYDSKKQIYNQVTPLNFRSSQHLEFTVVFYKGTIYIAQENMLVLKIEQGNEKSNGEKRDYYLGL